MLLRGGLLTLAAVLHCESHKTPFGAMGRRNQDRVAKALRWLRPDAGWSASNSNSAVSYRILASCSRAV